MIREWEKDKANEIESVDKIVNIQNHINTQRDGAFNLTLTSQTHSTCSCVNIKLTFESMPELSNGEQRPTVVSCVLAIGGNSILCECACTFNIL